MKRHLLLALAAIFVAFAASAQGSIPSPGKAIAAKIAANAGKKKVSNSSSRTGTAKSKKATTGTLNGHEWVDLGLTSGTKWATESTSKTIPFRSAQTLVDKEFGNGWVMPDKNQMDELFAETTYSFGLDDDLYVEFTGPNGNSIRITIFEDRWETDYFTSFFYSLSWYEDFNESLRDFVQVYIDGLDQFFYIYFQPSHSNLNPVAECIADEINTNYSEYPITINAFCGNSRMDEMTAEMRIKNLRQAMDDCFIMSHTERVDPEFRDEMNKGLKLIKFPVRPVVEM